MKQRCAMPCGKPVAWKQLKMHYLCCVIIVLLAAESAQWVIQEDKKSEKQTPTNSCKFGEKCVLLSYCRNECNSVQKRRLQSDLRVRPYIQWGIGYFYDENFQYREHLKKAICGITPVGHIKVCCSNSYVSTKAHCNERDDLKPSSSVGSGKYKKLFIW